MSYARIKKIHLQNFKKYEDDTIQCNPELNIFVGDNGTGKSSVLQAIDLTLSGSITKVAGLGLENLFNINVINAWLKSPSLSSIPALVIELFFSELDDSIKSSYLFGEKFMNNDSKSSEYGIKLICELNPDFCAEIDAKISSGEMLSFPYDYYTISFSTFADHAYTKYLKPFYSVFIDNASINATKMMQFVIENIYYTSADDRERIALKQRFREHIEKFVLPQAMDENGMFISADIENFLDVKCNGVRLQNSGQGKINLCKTQSALLKNMHESSVFMFEEPENHLSYKNLHLLIELIKSLTSGRQIFIATHSSYITTRLGLRNAFFVNDEVCSLSDLSNETSRFFQKVPGDNLLQFVLSKKVILVEGAAEYILIDKFARQVTNNSLSELGIWVIALNNLSFARYLELAKFIGLKVAVVRDNDGKVKEWYPDYKSDNIKIFVESDTTKTTFEICLYSKNQESLDILFEDKKDVQEYMLKNKAEAAFSILEADCDINVPEYIAEAIQWINS